MHINNLAVYILILTFLSAIFSKIYIEAGEELCFHYNEGRECVWGPNLAKAKPCLCGTGKCEMFLPNMKI